MNTNVAYLLELTRSVSFSNWLSFRLLLHQQSWKCIHWFLLVYSFPKPICHDNESGFTETRLASLLVFSGLSFTPCVFTDPSVLALQWILLLRSLYEKIMNNLAHEELHLHYIFASIGERGREGQTTTCSSCVGKIIVV